MLAMNQEMTAVLELAGFIQSTNPTEFLPTPDTYSSSSAGAYTSRNNINNTVSDGTDVIPSMIRQSGFHGEVLDEEYPVVVGYAHSGSCCCNIS